MFVEQLASWDAWKLVFPIRLLDFTDVIWPCLLLGVLVVFSG
jgi:hypothetical protein